MFQRIYGRGQIMRLNFYKLYVSMYVNKLKQARKYSTIYLSLKTDK